MIEMQIRHREKQTTVMNHLRVLLAISLLLGCLISCATTGPAIVKMYGQDADRSQIAIVRLDQKMSLRIVGCDGIIVPSSVRYLLIQPGRHELVFKITGQTLVSVYNMSGKKFMDAAAGHTYMLKSETGWLSIGDKWFPAVIDVTDDKSLHVSNIPKEEVQLHD